jgi:hypothetical protein
MDHDQKQHHSANPVDLFECIWQAALQNRFGDVAGKQREEQRDARDKKCAEHHGEEQASIGFVVGKKLSCAGGHKSVISNRLNEKAAGRRDQGWVSSSALGKQKATGCYGGTPAARIYVNWKSNR